MTEARVIHFEIVGKDGVALQRYYSDLFGWALDTSNPGGYGMTDPATTGPVVGIGSTPDGSSGHVTGYVRVADINSTLAKVKDLGGSGRDAQVQPGRLGAARAGRRSRGPRRRPDRVGSAPHRQMTVPSFNR